MMNTRVILGALGLTAALGTSGCFTAELDPDLGGAFFCEGTGDEEECPSGLTCVNNRCEDADALPNLTVLNPEDEGVLSYDAANGSSFPLVISIRGTGLELVAANAGSAPAFGQGYVAVFVDGAEQRAVDEGAIDSPTGVEVTVRNTPGPHRIMLQAMRNDGRPYNNEGAVATRLFWIDDGGQPYVAIKSPWPGTELNADAQDLEVEVATLRFTVIEPGSDKDFATGHVHVYYNTTWPDCVDDEVCDKSYIGTVTSEDDVGTVGLPSAQTTSSDNLTAVLRHIDHDPYLTEFSSDTQENIGDTVFDVIEVTRVTLD